jgi:3-oxoacyl-(acyl-carrier-protein) synthase
MAYFDKKIEEVASMTTLANLGPDSHLDYVPNIGRKAMDTVMSNALAFGGTPAALLAGKMKRWE